MAQECGFFNAQLVGEEYDRVYLAEHFAAYFASFIGNGVFGSSMQQLEVVAQDVPNMSVNVLSGQAWINGWWYRNRDAYTLSHSVADGVLSRIDIVVLRWDHSARDMYLAVIEGTPSANPVKPAIVRNADYYDLQLCEVSIPAGSVRITQAQITDTRLDNSVCGLVTGVVDQIDTTDLFTQFMTAYQEWKDNQQADYEEWKDEQQADYEEWFDDIKGQISDDEAVRIQLELDELRDNIAEEYSERTYYEGEFCIHDNKLYKSRQAITNPEEWNNNHWVEVTVGEVLLELADGIIDASASPQTIEKVSTSGTSETYRLTLDNGTYVDITSSSGLLRGTCTGALYANATSAATLATSQFRNIKASTTDLTAGSSALTSGDIYIVYE